MKNGKSVMLGACLISPFFIGIIVACVLLANGFPAWSSAISVVLGILPAMLYAIGVKINEHKAFKKVNISEFTSIECIVKSCVVSSYSANDRSSKPHAFRLYAEANGKVYKTYCKKYYECGSIVEIYVDKNGRRARVLDCYASTSDPNSISALYSKVANENQRLFDTICETCDDDTFDLVYGAWEAECKTEGSMAYHKSTLLAYSDIDRKYFALLERFENNKTAEGLIRVTQEQMQAFLSELATEEGEAISDTVTDNELLTVNAGSDTQEITDCTYDREVADVAKDIPDTAQAQQRHNAAKPNIGYKGIKRK